MLEGETPQVKGEREGWGRRGREGEERKQSEEGGEREGR